MAVRISENMGNPRIDDTRINVYDVVSELKFNTPPAKIAELFMLTDEQVQAALQFIETHREEVEAGYRRVMDPEKRRNPPELQAKIDATSAKYAISWADRYQRMQSQENGDERTAAGH